MKISTQGLRNLPKKTYLEYIRLFPVLQKEKNKQYGMLTLTFATMIFFAIFAINPTLTTIAQLQRKLADARLVEKELSKKITNLGVLQDKFQALTPDYNLILAAIPQSPKAALFLGQLQAIAKQSAVELTSLQTEGITLASVNPSKNNRFSFSIEVSGTYENIHAFLTLLTQFERIVTVTSLSIAKDSVYDREMSVSIHGEAYFLK
jgi:Tfp pilus assembly protein PilO